ncbi:MAG: hypothetical protein Q9191_004101 [Dirinaria sp. TL-2023a]
MFASENLDHIANLGEQCRCWLLDVAEQVPVTWHLSGFDVSTDQFPTNAYLPHNVSLQQMDAFDNIPPALVESFDIVHVRAVCVVVKGGDPKPNGYLQWDDFDPDSFVAYTPYPQIAKASSDEIIAMWASYAKKLDLDFRWLSNLSDRLSEQGLRVTESKRFGPMDKVRKAATDDWMVALEETMFVILNRSSESEDAKRRFADLLKKTVEETKGGVGMWIDWLIVVGVKE